MNARSLQEDLLSIPGVEGAEVEGTSDKPAGLRIRIAEGADQTAVGGAIRRVLTSHGLGTDTRLPGEAAGDTQPPQLVQAEEGAPVEQDSDIEAEPAPAAVAVIEETPSNLIDLTDDDADVDEYPDEDLSEPEALEGASQPEPVVADDEPYDADVSAAADVVPQAEPEPAPASQPAPVGVVRISSVSVEEGRGGITVTVTSSDGASVTRPAASNEGGVESAVIRAAAHLARPDEPDVVVIDIDDRRVEGVDIVMLVLELDSEISAGSAVVGAGRSFALARATWSALSM